MSKSAPKAIIAILTLSSILAITSCGGADKASESHKATYSEQDVAVLTNADLSSAITIELNKISDTKSIGALYTSDDMAQARARIGGTLVRLNVTEGSFVGQGQVIGIIDEARFGAEIAAGQANAMAAQSAASAATASARQAPAQLAAAQAMAQKAQSDYNRTKILFDQGVYAQAKLDQMRAAMLAANAQVGVANAGIVAANANADASRAQAQSASANADIARAVRAQGQIIAPRAGRVVMVPATQGSVLMPGEIIASIAVGEPVLRLFVPEADAKYIAIGQSLETQGTINSDISNAKISKIYPMVENGQVKLDLIPSSATRFIGERVEVKVPIGNRDAILIPANYIITRQGVDFVRLLSGNTPLEVPVQRGSVQGAKIEIISGLNIGDKIIAPNGGRRSPATSSPAKH